MDQETIVIDSPHHAYQRLAFELRSQRSRILKRKLTVFSTLHVPRIRIHKRLRLWPRQAGELFGRGVRGFQKC